MTDKIAAAAAGVTAREDFLDLDIEALRQLLGRDPRKPEARLFRAFDARNWPSDKTGQEYFHRGLARILWKRGGTVDAAQFIRSGLEDGHLHAVVIDDDSGEEGVVKPQH